MAAQRAQRLVFFGLVIAVLGARALEPGAHFGVGITSSILIAIGIGVIEIPVSIGLGRIALWFAEKLLLFGRNILNPVPKIEFRRTIWQTLSLSLAMGWVLLRAMR